MSKMDRCDKCHTAIIPDEVLDIWEKKFGKREKPAYFKVCKLCGMAADQHYGTDCPDERVKKLAGQRDALLAALESIRKVIVKLFDDADSERFTIHSSNTENKYDLGYSEGKFKGVEQAESQIGKIINEAKAIAAAEG